MPAYTKIQFIGYSMYTAPTMEVTVDNKKVPPKYVGRDISKIDIECRVKVMAAAIETARKQPAIDNGEGTLKLFMSPEFFFRGCKGAYEKQGIPYAIKCLHEIVGHSKWKDWLFVFASTIGSTETQVGKRRIYNVVFVTKGYTTTDADSRLVLKEMISGRDFLDTDGSKGVLFKHTEPPVPLVVTQRTSCESLEYLAGAAGKNTSIREDARGSIFDLDGVRFAVEVCADHGNQRLRKAPAKKGAKKVQVHLVPSAGMAAMPHSVVAQTGGFVFNVDGGTNQAQSTPSVVLHKVTQENFKGADDMNNKATLSSLHAQASTQAVPSGMLLPERLFARAPGEPVVPGQAKFVSAGKVVIFPAQTLPAETKH